LDVHGVTSHYSDVSMNSKLDVHGVTSHYSDVNIIGDLTVSGTITADSFYATSDYRIKEEIVSLNDTPFNVDDIRPVYYYNKLTHKKDIGFIAHEIQEIYSFLVNGEKDGKENQSVQYTGLIGLMIKEIQELKKNNKNTNLIIENLNKKILQQDLIIQSLTHD